MLHSGKCYFLTSHLFLKILILNSFNLAILSPLLHLMCFCVISDLLALFFSRLSLHASPISPKLLPVFFFSFKTQYCSFLIPLPLPCVVFVTCSRYLALFGSPLMVFSLVFIWRYQLLLSPRCGCISSCSPIPCLIIDGSLTSYLCRVSMSRS